MTPHKAISIVKTQVLIVFLTYITKSIFLALHLSIYLFIYLSVRVCVLIDLWIDKVQEKLMALLKELSTPDS